MSCNKAYYSIPGQNSTFTSRDTALVGFVLIKEKNVLSAHELHRINSAHMGGDLRLGLIMCNTDSGMSVSLRNTIGHTGPDPSWSSLIVCLVWFTITTALISPWWSGLCILACHNKPPQTYLFNDGNTAKTKRHKKSQSSFSFLTVVK